MPSRSLRTGLCTTVATMLISAMAWTAPAAVATAPASVNQADSVLAQDAMNVEQLVEKVGPAVVTVYNLAVLEGGFGQDDQSVQQGSGTGFVVSKDGYIVTNWHVVTTGQDFAVGLQDGTLVEAELIGTDARDDLAVVKIDPKHVKVVVNFADSSTVKPGQEVVAIGSPLGAFTNTVTSGIVSALGRNDFGGQSGNCQNYTNLIQHDAPINPGNSGGPLFNMKGEVIGVNTLGLPVAPDGTPLQGLFFAVPSNMAKNVATQLIQNGKISAPYIGITQQQVTAADAQANGLDIPGGSLVLDVVRGGPADEAGIQVDDIILQIDETVLTDKQNLATVIVNFAPGDTVTMSVLRDGETVEVELTFGELDQDVLDECRLG